MQRIVNARIKNRESFRPLAPAVLDSQAAEFFEIPTGHASPYMSLVAQVSESKRVEHKNEPCGLAKLDVVRSQIPAVTHVDGSARIQTVDPARHPRLHRLLEEFHARSGCPLVLNTSLNVRGEPIVCTPPDAYRCFMETGMDVLVMEHCVVMKSQQPAQAAGDMHTAVRGPESRRSITAPKSSIVPIDWRPDGKKLKRFSLFWLAFFGLVFAPIALAAGQRGAFYVLTAIGAAGWLCGAMRPQWLRWPYIALSLLTYPVGWLVSHVLLGIAFYAVLTPIGWWRQLRGRERMPRRGERHKDTYWEHRDTRPGLAGYLRQF